MFRSSVSWIMNVGPVPVFSGWNSHVVLIVQLIRAQVTGQQHCTRSTRYHVRTYTRETSLVEEDDFKLSILIGIETWTRITWLLQRVGLILNSLSFDWDWCLSDWNWVSRVGRGPHVQSFYSFKSNCHASMSSNCGTRDIHVQSSKTP